MLCNLNLIQATDELAMNKSVNIFSTEHITKMYEFCDRIRDKQFSVKDINIPYQWVNNWDKEGLLFEDDREDGKWRKFNFIDYLWIKIIVELREFGLSYDVIKKLREVLSHKIELEPLTDKKKTILGNSNMRYVQTASLNSVSLLTFLIVEAIATKALIKILIHKDGEALLVNERNLFLYGPELEEFQKQSFLTISLNHLLIEFVGKHDLDLLLPFIPLISTEEAELLQLIREESITRLCITDHEGKSYEWFVTDLESAGVVEMNYLQYIINRPYRFIEFETSDEKIVKFKYKTRGSTL